MHLIGFVKAVIVGIDGDLDSKFSIVFKSRRGKSPGVYDFSQFESTAIHTGNGSASILCKACNVADFERCPSQAGLVGNIGGFSRNLSVGSNRHIGNLVEAISFPSSIRTLHSNNLLAFFLDGLVICNRNAFFTWVVYLISSEFPSIRTVSFYELMPNIPSFER